jgi:hypothetical protein
MEDETCYQIESDSGIILNMHASTLTDSEIERLLAGGYIHIGFTAFRLIAND